jgi:RHS repeat-associated protein
MVQKVAPADPSGVYLTTNYLNFDPNFNVQEIDEVPSSGGATRKTLRTFDSNNNLLTEEDPQRQATDGKQRVWTYTNNIGSGCSCVSYPATYTDYRGNKTTYNFDTHGNLQSALDDKGFGTSYSYDSFGQVIQATDAEGHITTYTYDGFGDLTQVHTDAGNVNYAYDDLGRVTSVTDELGHATSYTLDGVGNALVTTFMDQSFIQCSYDSHGNQTSCSVQLPNGSAANGSNSNAYSYDLADQMVSVTDPLGHVNSFLYDNDGNRKQTTDPKNHLWSTVFDNLDRPHTLTDPLGSTTLDYDAFGNRSAVTDANTNKTAYTYDGVDRLLTITQPNVPAGGQPVTTFVYDPEGNRTDMYDPDGNSHHTQWVYDDRNLLTDEIDANGTTVKHYFYYKNRLINTLTDGNNTVTTYLYDGANRLTSETPNQNGTGYSYDYGAPGQAGVGFNLFHAGGETFLYDNLDRLTTDTKATGEVLTHTYDSRGNRLGTTLNFRSGSGASPVSQAWFYDFAGRNYQATDFSGGVKNLVYDEANRLTSEALPNRITSTYIYDNANHLTDLINKNRTGSALSLVHYGIDQVGNRKDRTDLFGKRTYTYDATYQLTDVSTKFSTATGNLAAAQMKTDHFTFDLAGNRTGRTQVFTPSNTVTKSFTPDLANQLDNNVTQTFDGNGNLKSTQSGTETLTWDFRNRLILVHDSANPNDWSGTYDFNNRIASKTVGTTTTNFIYDDMGRLLAETDSSGNPLNLYSYDSLGLIGAKPGRGRQHYDLFDGLGSAVQVTDKDGSLLREYNYLEFGEAQWSGGDASNPFRFTGRWGGYADSRVGRVLEWNRWYNPSEGRWDSRDPLGINGGVNLYDYVENSPLDFFDSTGFLVTIGYHPALFSSDPYYHLTVVLRPDNPSDFGCEKAFADSGGKLATIGGQLYLGKLVHRFNYAGDQPDKLIGEIAINHPKNMSDTEFIRRLIDAANTYRNDKTYNPFPQNFDNTFNSNSYVSGLIQAAGGFLQSVPVPVPGYNKPLSFR